MNKLILILLPSLFLSGCAISMIMVNTSGQATDVVDEAQTTKTDVSPKFPGSLIPLK
ncbi:MAG: hypothetical protein ACRDAI_05735 [Candidatus Rhabdochlamydia sp.]